MKKLFRKEEGFTIIEVVLVLAIAGLIFLVVFLALPQLQASRRDTQRKSDAGRLLAAIENWSGNHNGNYPGQVELNAANGPDWITANMSGSFDDPGTGDPYVFIDDSAGNTGFTAAGEIDYGTGVMCNPDADGFSTSTGTRRIAVIMNLENGQFCQDNQ